MGTATVMSPVSSPDNKADAVEEAMALLGKWPIPKDAEEQLDGLYKIASADDRKCCFPHLYSALFLLRNGPKK